ncbi:MAG: type II toxin-antitoxin system HicB family antitoxin [Candidatus Diapherotrites archaeon]
MNTFDFLAVIIPEGGSFSAWSPNLDIASQGDTVEEAIANLKEAIELHIECLTPCRAFGVREQEGPEDGNLC